MTGDRREIDRRKAVERRSQTSGGGDHVGVDPRFDLSSPSDSAEYAIEAMQVFVAGGDVDAFENAISVYVRAAQSRGETIESIVAGLNSLTSATQARYRDSGRLLEPSDMQKLVLRGVLRSYYGKSD